MGEIINLHEERKRREKPTTHSNVVDIRNHAKAPRPLHDNDNNKKAPEALPLFNSTNPEIKKIEDAVQKILLDDSLRDDPKWEYARGGIVRLSANYAKYSKLDVVKGLKDTDEKDWKENPVHFVMLAEAYCEILRKGGSFQGNWGQE